MNSKEYWGLMEAYSEVYNVLDEAIRNPESRAKLRDIEDREVRKGDKSKGENPRVKYPNEKGKLAGQLLRGPESTGSKGNPVRSRGGTNAPADERVGRGPHRAGNAAYWAGNAGPDRDRGAGNKAARRAGKSVPNTRDMDENYDVYDIILSHLLDEGYAETPEAAEVIMVNMSEEWREDIMEGMTMKDFMANRRKNERRAASADAKSRGHVDKFTGKPYSTDEARSRRKGIHTPAAAPSRDAARDAAGGETGRGGRLRPNKVRKAKALGELGEQVDLYDIILSHLLDEGYAETPEAAEVIMVNMSEEWRESIVEELITEISLKTKMRSYAATQDPDADYSYGDKVHAQGGRIHDAIVRKHGKKAGEHADAHADSSAWGRTDSRTGKKQERPEPRSSSIAGKSLESQKRKTKSGKMNKTDQKTLKDKLQRRASERRSGETSSTHHPSFYHR